MDNNHQYGGDSDGNQYPVNANYNNGWYVPIGGEFPSSNAQETPANISGQNGGFFVNASNALGGFFGLIGNTANAVGNAAKPVFDTLNIFGVETPTTSGAQGNIAGNPNAFGNPYSASFLGNVDMRLVLVGALAIGAVILVTRR